MIFSHKYLKRKLGTRNCLFIEKKKKSLCGDQKSCARGPGTSNFFYLVLLRYFEIYINPINNVKRRVKGQGEQFVSQPKCIQEYNEGMGGLDQMDRLLQSYRPTIHMRKWWFALFVNLLNASVTASWRLYLWPTQKVR